MTRWKFECEPNTVLCVVFTFILSLLPQIGFSLGFGAIKLYSYLNEPLDAEITLQGAEDIDTSHLIVSLASVEDFKRIELARPYFLSKLRFEVVQKNKEAVLKVTTEEPVKQPYLEFLVVLTWPEGRVVRDYTLLLDPAPFGGLSKRAANEQALRMLNKVNSEEREALSGTSETISAGDSIPFEDAQAIQLLQKRLTKADDSLPPTQIAEAKSVTSVNDIPSNLIAADQKNVAKNSINQKDMINVKNSVNSTDPQDTTHQNNSPVLPEPAVQPTKINQSQASTPQSNVTVSRNHILVGSALALLLFVGLTAWILRRARSSVRLPFANNLDLVEDIVMFDEEIKLKLDLAHQYMRVQDMQNAETILEEIIARGNSEEIRLAKALLKKINHT